MNRGRHHKHRPKMLTELWALVCPIPTSLSLIYCCYYQQSVLIVYNIMYTSISYSMIRERAAFAIAVITYYKNETKRSKENEEQMLCVCRVLYYIINISCAVGCFISKPIIL